MCDIYICELCLNAYGPQDVKGVGILREFERYTIDFRLRQFRKINLNELAEFIDFSSEKGRKLLLKMHERVLKG